MLNDADMFEGHALALAVLRSELGSPDDVDDAEAKDAPLVKEDNPGKAIGQEGDRTPPGQAGKDHEPGPGAPMPKPKPAGGEGGAGRPTVTG